MRALKLEVWVPSQLESGQVLEIVAGEWSDRQELGPDERRTLEIPLALSVGDSVEVTIRAQEGWCPKDSGTSEDDRVLAYKLISTIVEH